MSSKEEELRKYLEKKKKQKTRDRLMEEIAALSHNRTQGLDLTLIKARKKRRGDARGRPGSDMCHSEEQERDGALEQHAAVNQNETHEPIHDIEDCVHQLVQMPDNCDLKDGIIALQEHFETRRCARADAIQDVRRRMDIFYEEHEIVSCIRYNLMTFIQGETGCGKTTQIPQFLLENGFASGGLIGMTQPRRFSAVSISCRLNVEMNENLSGFKIKYENSISDETKIKVMTEGILLKEIQSDFLLRTYSVIILDEVHERSSNLDVLVGLLSKVVKIRFQQGSPLRLVLMSATVDTEVFRGVLGEFAVLRLGGRMFRVDVFYEDRTVEEYLNASYNKIVGILESERRGKTRGRSRLANIPTEIENDFRASILVFLPTKDDIYSLKTRLDALHRSIVVLPLHSGLSKSEQNKVYETYGLRKIVLATNIAETSITIDDIVFVIDSGRVKYRAVDRSTVLYRIGLISKSSAKQRMGRAGRTKAGVCYRMYSGETYEALAPRGIPQILLEPLDSILLQLKCMGVQNIFSFPFIDMPGEQSVGDALESLQDIGAIDSAGNITKLGRKMCQYPVPPRYARLLLLENDSNMFHKLAIIVSVLVSSLDLKRTERTQKYFISEKSDLVVALKMVLDYLESPVRRRFSSTIGISFDCLEEIRKMASYLMQIGGKSMFTMEMDSTMSEQICRALYCGFADQVAVNSGSSYLCKGGEVFISGESVDPAGQSIVFDHIVCGKRSYAKGITVISPGWLE